jgi:hypothetical protein
MVRMLSNTGFPGRQIGRPAVCPRLWDIAPGANGRSLPVDGST